MSTSQVERFVTTNGTRIYRLPVEVFPNFVGYAYLLVNDACRLLVDTGSVFPQSAEDLLAALDTVRERFGEPVSLDTLDGVVISHGHIDHFGGLTPLRERIRGPIFVHELDRRVLTNFKERVVVVSKALERFLEQAGVKPALRAKLRDMYLFAKTLVTPVEHVDVLQDGQRLFGFVEVIHTPGHCPGQVCLKVDDILLSSDHVLPRTTPHLAPERITAYTGLGHYLESLDKIVTLAGDVRLTLGGHEEPIEDLEARVRAIRRSHERKLERFLELCREPRTVAELSMDHYGRREGYDILLAIEEAGAHVEYLYERGYLAIANLDEVEHASNPVLRYRRL